jgi:anaerobic magnesium-protoporphyrin IX monomethyl ester cyclase
MTQVQVIERDQANTDPVNMEKSTPDQGVARILLINPPYVKDLYSKSKLRATTWNNPPVSLVALAATIDGRHDIKILDLNVEKDPLTVLQNGLDEFRPTIVGITFTTATINRMVQIADAAKAFDKDINVVVGGPHATGFPEDTLAHDSVDIVVRGEGDFSFPEIIEGNDLETIDGISFKTEDGIINNLPRTSIKNLDILPNPAWHLYDLTKVGYKNSRLVSRKNPAGFIETSRGCVYKCTFCNKNIFGRRFGKKSPERVIEEIKFMLASGFKEIHIVDDMFSTDIKRAKKICDMIMEENLKFPWTLQNGLRVDSVDEELLFKLKQAGCYRVTFGVESGNQRILDNIKKEITLDQVRNAVKWGNKAGLEIFGYFMLALPGETVETMDDTINFAKELDFDYVKFTVMMPLPDTEIYDDMLASGHLSEVNWDEFHFHTQGKDVYRHPTLDWDTINVYYRKAFNAFYLRPSYIWKRFKKGILEGTMLHDVYYFINTFLTVTGR